MPRITSIALLFGGAALLVTWIVSPASSAPQTPAPAPAPSAAGAPSSQSAPDAPVDVEPVRLPDVSAPPPEYRRPVRNPFSFSAPEPRPASTVDIPPPEMALEPPAPVLPSLVAIMTDATPEGERRRAALSNAAGEVRIVRAGDAYGAFSISDITAGAVALTDTSTGLTYRVPLR